MSRVGKFGCLCAVAACALSAHAQYPGRVQPTQQQPGTHLRATAVLEYTGDLKNPKASRLIPLAIWDGMQYQPGGLYLAQPAPLAVLSGTQYELEKDGKSQGFFDVGTAENLGGQWIGLGHYQAPPAPKKLQPARHMPRVVKDYDPDKPHFAHRPADDNQGDQSGTTTGTPPVDPDRPTLHPRGGGAGNAGQETNAPPVDPDRPTFHREEPASAGAGSESGTTAAPAVDPDRPLLHYGAPAAQEKLDQPDALAGIPEEMKQITGVSDTRSLDAESYNYSWSSPEDQDKMKAALEAVAEQALAPPPPSPKAKPAGKSSAPAHRRPQAAPAEPAPPVLKDEEFRVFSLTFGGGATMVLSARSASEPAKYVTIIAEPDFYGQAQVLLKQVTTDGQLDLTPRMRLVDAVDTEGNGRADLIFELRGSTYRQFAIYRVAGGSATQVFATQPASL
jgi:hypothetical protein